ncbi:histone deacetylase family protein [Pseudorhodobacter sp.]|uniref:histone deacetylase family protein n=1 Tax=Pseudorhodobacter sp. TaxID=1934400 RepID=UPI0026496053|nr:histone deacetylase family protein [Pseudorhodobacter sp.]MDN5788994.1 histone deacetylase family protein [Pseudorhodobacter sp.]
MTTALFTHPDCDLHHEPPGHPEQVARLAVVAEALAGFDLLRVDAPLGIEADITRCHPMRYIDRCRAAVPASGWGYVDGDTYLAPGSFQAALRGVGGVCAAVDLVLAGGAANAFVATRPPGHHAERETAMGFCLFGNIAIAAKHALDHHRLSRVAIVDFDVHHGNGTQELLWDEACALFASSHQMPLYPGSGSVSEKGAHGQIHNLPLRPNTKGAEMRAGYEAHIFPAIDAFAPELILISAGFDAHRDDPLANLNWSTDDFTWLTRRICDLADTHCAGRVVSALEGGYDLPALAASAAAHVAVLKERGE